MTFDLSPSDQYAFASWQAQDEVIANEIKQHQEALKKLTGLREFKEKQIWATIAETHGLILADPVGRVEDNVAHVRVENEL